MIDNRPRKTDRRVMTPRERLDSYSWRNEDGCLIFTRGGSATKYPMIWVNGKKMTTSRAQWTVTYGEPPADLVVRHKCDVRNCIELTHLELGTYADNTADMHERGRAATKLSRDQATMIRLMSETGVPVKEIATAFGVVKQTIYNVLNGDTWNV